MPTKKNTKTKKNDISLANATVDLNEKSREFAHLRETAEQNSTEATRAMLKQTQLVCEVVDRYKGNNFHVALLKFRADTGLNSSSKFSQFKRIGSVATQLLAVADRLPSGWSSLYVIAAAMRHKTKSVSLENLLDANIKQFRLVARANGDKEKVENGALSLNAYSTQSEVRALVAFAGGRVPVQRVPKQRDYATLTDIGLPELRISVAHTTSESIAADADALRNALGKVLKQFPWVVFEPASAKVA